MELTVPQDIDWIRGDRHMGKRSQRKGRAWELEICRIFQTHGIEARPGAPVSFGSTPDVVGIPGIHAEVKRVERLNVPEAMNQAVRDCEKFRGGRPALFHRRDRSPWLATTRLEDWIRGYLSPDIWLEVPVHESEDAGRGARPPVRPHRDLREQRGGPRLRLAV